MLSEMSFDIAERGMSVSLNAVDKHVDVLAFAPCNP